MAGKQDQTVSDEGTAVQAGGDVSIGLSGRDVVAILEQVTKLIPYTSEAKFVSEERLAEFREELVAQFAKPDGANPEALKEPDFQYMIGGTQEAYARSGDEVVKGTLIDIVTRRSKAEHHSREAETLNEAAIRAPKLTKSEFAALTLAYLVRHTINNGVTSAAKLASYLNSAIVPFVKDVSAENSSYWHIEAQSCGTLNSLSTVELRNALVSRYGGLLGKGATLEEFENNAPEGSKHLVKGLLIQCIRDTTKFQPNAVSEAVFKDIVATKGYDPQLAVGLWAIFAPTIPDEAGMIEMLRPEVPEIAALFKAWGGTPLRTLQVNSVGIAIGHANAVRVTSFDAPLATWIK